LLDPASTLWAGASGPLFHYFRGCSPAERERGVRRSRWRHSRSRAMAKLAPATPLQAPSHHARTSLALRTPSPRHFSATHTIAGSQPKLWSRRLGATDPPNDDMQHPQLLHDPLITLHTPGRVPERPEHSAPRLRPWPQPGNVAAHAFRPPGERNRLAGGFYTTHMCY
jgi:hypothetical protein